MSYRRVSHSRVVLRASSARTVGADDPCGPAWVRTTDLLRVEQALWPKLSYRPNYVFPGFLKEIGRFPAGMLPAGEAGS